MRRVTGIGGIFFKSEDPEHLYQWHEQHLGIRRAPDGMAPAFEWRETDDADKEGMTVWSIFPRNTKYFDPSGSAFMINYRVDDLDALLEALKAEGVQIDPHREDYDYGLLCLDHGSGGQSHRVVGAAELKEVIASNHRI